MKDVRKKILAAAAMTIMLAGCNSEEGLPVGENVQDMAHFSATIHAPGTRAYDQIWEANDEIGISGTSGDVVYTNVCHLTADGSGSFNPKDESKKIYFQDDNEVTFTAYYPWNDLKGSTTITADTWGQGGTEAVRFPLGTRQEEARNTRTWLSRLRTRWQRWCSPSNAVMT
ncbi:fimbrillin family protein [Parabacteroides distasonis]|nr:fimbrillin family protein [Parabacteroides distasonis]